MCVCVCVRDDSVCTVNYTLSLKSCPRNRTTFATVIFCGVKVEPARHMATF